MTLTQARTQHPDIAEAAEMLRDELEFIDYAMGHDLLAPLRLIQSHCEALSQEPTNKEALSSIAQEAARLKILMQGLRDYIQLETFATTPAPLDVNEILHAAKATLAQEIESTHAVITAQNLPKIMAHRGRMVRLFAYIVSNALTFCSAEPRIHISARRVDNMWEFCVEDNGIGIDAEYHEIIFRLFQRLHSEAYPGHGIGLTLAQRIAQAHGGTMWVTSELQKGSRFYFTLPALPNA